MSNGNVKNIKALIFGATGYTGIELIRILSSHPEVTVVGGSSRKWAGKRADDVFPFLPSGKSFSLEPIDEMIAEPDADVAFLALPHGESASTIRPLLEKGVKVVDLSADCRLADVEIYAQWYGEQHDNTDTTGDGTLGTHNFICRTCNIVSR